MHLFAELAFLSFLAYLFLGSYLYRKGKEKLVANLSNYSPLSPSEMGEKVIEDTHLHSLGTIQSDDITILGLKYLG